MPGTGARSLLDCLAARAGLVCAVGAGGKKSTLYRLVQAHASAGTSRVGLSTTVLTAPPPPSLGGVRLIAKASELRRSVPSAAADSPLVIFAEASPKLGRLGGVPPDQLAELHRRARFDVTLVKADGARMRLIKAPAEDEPALPPGTTTVLAVVSIKAIGQPLNETIAHRPERVAAVTGAVPGELLTVSHLARLLASDAGALHRAGQAEVVPIVNMVDDDAQRALAREVAREALRLTRRFDRVALSAMTAEAPIVETVRR
jgi:probable selenium-dependent hydroxylase accessory protein YqeC